MSSSTSRFGLLLTEKKKGDSDLILNGAADLWITLIVTLGLVVYYIGLRELGKYNTAWFLLLLLMPAASCISLYFFNFNFNKPD